MPAWMRVVMVNVAFLRSAGSCCFCLLAGPAALHPVIMIPSMGRTGGRKKLFAKRGKGNLTAASTRVAGELLPENRR